MHGPSSVPLALGCRSPAKGLREENKIREFVPGSLLSPTPERFWGTCSMQFSLLLVSCDPPCPVTPLGLQWSQSWSFWPRLLYLGLASPAPCPQALDLILSSISFPRIILLQEGHLPPPWSLTPGERPWRVRECSPGRGKEVGFFPSGFQSAKSFKQSVAKPSEPGNHRPGSVDPKAY